MKRHSELNDVWFARSPLSSSKPALHLPNYKGLNLASVAESMVSGMMFQPAVSTQT